MIAACMIVKDAAGTIEECLASIRPFVDGVFIYDTGSTDDTLAVLERLNVKRLYVNDGQVVDLDFISPERLEAEGILDVPLAPITVQNGEWRDDFSWAREQSFAMPGDEYTWLLWLDDDDVIHGAHNLRPLTAQARPEVDGFVCMYDYARDDHGNTICVLWRERLIRRSAGLHWVNPVHEVLVPADGRAPRFAQVGPEILRYVHNRPAERYEPDRNLKILTAQADAARADGREPDARTLAYLGTEHMAKNDFATGAGYLQGYLDRPDALWSDERMQVAHKLATCARMLGNPNAAVEIEMQALRERDDWAETYVGLMEAFAHLDRPDRVERWALRAIELGAPQTALIVNPLEFGLLPRIRLSEVYEKQGRWAEAETQLLAAAQAAPGQQIVADRVDQLRQAKMEGETLGALLTLREVLVRHDENEKAFELLERAVPYVVADHPAVVRARADQREMVRHLTHPAEYRRWYEDDPKESTLTDEHIDHVDEWFGRVAGLLRGLKAQEQELGRPPIVLDLGCNDWWMGEKLAREGYRCDGVELNKRSFEKATERAARFGRDVTIVQGDLHDARDLLRSEWATTNASPNVGTSTDPEWLKGYDAVVMYEVLEHVPDVQRTLDVMESLLAPGGRIYLSTPNGAFEHGQIPGWAIVERKGHLRATPIYELADMILNRGTIEDLEHTKGDRVAFASYTPRAPKGTVNFYAGAQFEPWSPLSIRDGGIGGSETALVQVATRMAMEGWKVRVYSSAEPSFIAGVLYRPFTAWDPTEEVDLLVVSRRPDLFDNPVGARSSALWCHDHTYEALTPERADRIDHVVVLSEWQRARFARLYPYAAGKLTIIRNGVSFSEIDEHKTPRYPNADRRFTDRKSRAVFSSSADRGLDVLLDVWPRIRERVPDAELHVFYGFNTLDQVAALNPGLAAFKQAILARVADLGGKDGGVHLRGRVGQVVLAEEMQQARVLAYPTAFLETSCITAMEARAAGLPIVTSALGALKETAKPGTLIRWASDEEKPHNRSKGYQRRFVDEVVEMLTHELAWHGAHDVVMGGAETLDWSRRIPEWEALAAAPEAARDDLGRAA